MYIAAEFFGKNNITLYHGSTHVIKEPSLAKSKADNDYGRGFYCTESSRLASEWSCPTLANGCLNEYLLNLSGLSLLDLASPEFTVLHWLSVLIAHRTFEVKTGAAIHARNFLLENYSVDLANADIVHGYRADDSYFSIARAFLDGHIGVRALEQSLFQGGLGYQIVLKSEKAFDALRFLNSTTTEGQRWNPLRLERDGRARECYRAIEARCFDDDLDDDRIYDLMRRSK